MKRFVDGREVELSTPPQVSVATSSDRLLVRGLDGVRSAVAIRSGASVIVSYLGKTFRVERAPSRSFGSHVGETGEIYAPMPGVIVDVFVQLDEAVADGRKLLVLEAMKTHQTFLAPFPGIVRRLDVRPTDLIREGQLLVQIEPEVESG